MRTLSEIPAFRPFYGMVFFAAGLIGAFSCKEQIRDPVSTAVFEEWFAGTGMDVPTGLLQSDRSLIDSLRTGLRNTSVKGPGSVVLADTFGVRYTTGFFTPASFRPDSTYPLIIYLHGGTGTERNDKGERAWEMLGMLSDSMDLFLASPSANRNAFWWSPAGLSRILQTLRYMALHYPVNPDKVFLAGVSDGATGCWAAANSISGPFAGFIAVSGFGGMLLQFGMKLYPQNLMQRPIYNVNAGKDRLYPLDAVNGFLDRLEQQGVGIQRREYPDEPHGFDYRDRERGALCTFIRAWSRPKTGTVNWTAPAGYPFCIGSVLPLDRPPGNGAFSVREFCRNDTICLHSSGLGGFQMYFDDNNFCAGKGVFRINGSRVRHLKSMTPDMKALCSIMKQRCFPVSINGLFYTVLL